MRRRKKLYQLVFSLIILALSCWALLWFLRPGTQPRTQIFQGIFLTVEETPSGRLMIVEVHWDTPGVQFSNRAYSFPVDPTNQDSPHYRTTFADWALFREGAAVLVNTTLFLPDSLKTFLPGYPVRSNETLVVDGEVSHVHDHSYLLYWDADGNVHLQRSKPPSPESLDAAVSGIGLQGIPVSQGQVRPRAISDHGEANARTFIGVDPERKVLFLMAFEKATPIQMLEQAVAHGVKVGGQVDGGSSTNLIIGTGAKDLPPHTGIRGWRPVGPYLIVKAESL
ncbi:MAG: phosphodiester glycosidase family protein [Puniceicoccaceae bacterium]